MEIARCEENKLHEERWDRGKRRDSLEALLLIERKLESTLFAVNFEKFLAPFCHCGDSLAGTMQGSR